MIHSRKFFHGGDEVWFLSSLLEERFAQLTQFGFVLILKIDLFIVNLRYFVTSYGIETSFYQNVGC